MYATNVLKFAHYSCILLNYIQTCLVYRDRLKKKKKKKMSLPFDNPRNKKKKKKKKCPYRLKKKKKKKKKNQEYCVTNYRDNN